MKQPALLRARAEVNNYFGALGVSRETVLTSTLGYLVARFPETLGPQLLGRGKTIRRVAIEERGEQGRHDIVLEAGGGDYLLEAKLGHNQNLSQLRRYLKTRRPKVAGLVLLDSGSDRAMPDLGMLTSRHKVRSVLWHDVWLSLAKLARSKKAGKKDIVAWAVAKEFCDHLLETGMVKNASKEIYARELSGPTVNLFFEHGIYRSSPGFYRLASQCQYFAPCFTARSLDTRSMIQLQKGISWVSKIRHIQVVDKKEIAGYLKEQGVKDSAKAAKATLQGLSTKQAMVLILNRPFQAFLTPVSKKSLNVRGTLGIRTFTFEQLFGAASKK